MVSRSEVLRAGVEAKLRENAREREQLLRIIGKNREANEVRATAMDILKATEVVADMPTKRRKRKPGSRKWTKAQRLAAAVRMRRVNRRMRREREAGTRATQ